MEETAENLIAETDKCEEAKKESHQKLEEMKVEFNQMKRDMQGMQEREQELKKELDSEGANKLKQKEHCDKMKQEIKRNRDKFKKQEKEFEGVIDLGKPAE